MRGLIVFIFCLATAGAYPQILTPPVLTGPNEFNSRDYNFECEAVLQHYSSSIAIELVWLFDGEEDPNVSREILTNKERISTLSGRLLDDHLNSDLGCQVRSYYVDYPDDKSPFVKSTTYFIGILFTPRSLLVDVDRNRMSRNVTAVSTVPIICDGNPESCCVNVEVNVERNPDISIDIPARESLCSDDWKENRKAATLKIPVSVSRSSCPVFDGDSMTKLTFDELTTSGQGGNIAAFRGITLPDITVLVKAKKERFTCSLTGVTHIKGFQIPGTFSMFKAGDFTAYEVPSRDVRVQIQTKTCSPLDDNVYVTCICGVIIQEKNDVIRVLGCDGAPVIHSAFPLSQDVIVERTPTGWGYKVSLPSGTKVQVDGYSENLNLFITTSNSDLGLGRGICGVNEENADDPVCSPGVSYCIPDDFVESWRLSESESRFLTVDQTDEDQTDSTSCGNSNSVRLIMSQNFTDVTRSVQEFYTPEEGWNDNPQTPYIPDEAAPFDPNVNWPNSNGVTESEARDKCMKAIQASQLFSKCEIANEVQQTSMENCLADILFGDTMEFLTSITTTVTTLCQIEIQNSFENYLNLEDDLWELKPEFQVCLAGCEEHGKCEFAGICVCDNGWKGVACQIESGKGPQLVSSNGGQLCDVVFQSDCNSREFDATNVNINDEIYCQIEMLTERGNRMNETVVRATVISPTRIGCQLPDLVTSNQLYRISAMSNNNTGSSVDVRVYNSTCLTCTPTRCAVKNNVCNIGNICYQAGARNENDNSQVCDPSQSRNAWTQLRPVMDSQPQLLGPVIVENDSFDFWCMVEFDHEDPSILYEAMWTFDGKEDPNVERQIFCYPQNFTTLDGAQLASHMNTNVGCRVRSFYESNPDDKTDFINSNESFAGLQVVPNELRVVEMEYQSNVELMSTVPILCSGGDSCCLNFDLEYNEPTGISVELPEQARLCSRDWNAQMNMASTEIPVKVQQDASITGNNLPSMPVTFEQNSPSGRGRYLDIFSGQSAGQFMINVEDEKFFCALYTDPHILNFDGRHYVVLQSGVYIAAEVPSRNFEVQTRVREAVNCGLVFRERNDVIRIDACFGSPTIDIANELSANTRVLISGNGRIYKILFPSGTEIQVGLAGPSRSVLNVFIILPGIDKNLSQGLCGTNDGNPDNDPAQPGRWRIPLEDSLFNKVPPETDSSTIISRVVPGPIPLCPGCEDITQTLTPGYSNESGWLSFNETVDDLPEESPINVDQTWPNAQGVTKEEATEECMKVFQRSQLNEICNSTFAMFLDDCLLDILYTGINYINDIAEVFTTSCLYDIAENPQNYELNTDVEVELDQVLDQVCLFGCGENGRCEEGTCVCQPGWEGDFCHLEAGKGPQLNEIIRGPLCDKESDECRSVTLVVTNIDLTDNLVCRIEILSDSDDSVIRTTTVKAKIISSNRISCDLPETEFLTSLYNIDVSNDGDLFGNIIQFRVYNSTCIECDGTECDIKSTVCVIDGICYRNGQENEDDSSQVCDVSENREEWTQLDPVIDSRPQLLGPVIVENNSFDFWCMMKFDHEDPNILYEVMWTFNGQEDPNVERQIFCYPQNFTTLDGAQLASHMNKNVRCRVRSFFETNPDDKTNFVDSNKYYVGLKVVPEELRVVEMEYEANVELVSTVPILCSGGGSCCLNFDLESSETQGLSIEAPEQARLCSRDWNSQLSLASNEIEVKVQQDACATVNNIPQMSVRFEPLPPTGRGKYLDIFSGQSAGQMKIIVKDEKSTCSLYTDPNVRSFDGRHYKVLQDGDYIAAEVPSRNFQVQTRVREAVNCGLIFRERNDVIRIDACFGSPMIEIARDLNEKTRVGRSMDSKIFGILFPSGTEIQVGLVNISSSVLNVFITLPGIDKNLSQGLCGNNDGNLGNDRNEAGKWKVSGADSLFNVVPSIDDSNCNSNRIFPDTGAWCPGCIDITNNLSPTFNDEDGWFLHNETLESSPEENPINPDQTWPLPSGLTEQDATEMCLQAIQSSPLYEVCNSTLRIQAFVQDCLTDILVTGTMNYIEGITGVFTTNCLYDTAENQDNQELNTDVEILLDQVCLTGCGENGRCENGVCVCQPGWEGETCFLDTSKGPQINRIIRSPLCDVNQEDCESVSLDISNADVTQSLYCRFDPVVEEGDISRDVTVKANILSPFFISCEVPDLETSTQLYNISVSNSSNLFGNTVQFRVYNSTCLECTISECVIKSTACVINGICYRDGQENEDDSSQVCDVSENIQEWTQLEPVIDSRPELLGPVIVEDNSFNFQCMMKFDHEDPNILYEVMWTFNGKEDPNIDREIFRYPQTFATLDGAQLTSNMNTNVRCRVRSFYETNPDDKTNFVRSNEYYVGLRVVPNELSVVEMEYQSNVELVSTVPILCSRGGSCCLNFDLEYSETQGISIETPNQARLCSRDWNSQLSLASNEIEVKVKQDVCATVNSIPQMTVRFEPLPPTGRGQYLDIFSGQSAGQMKIIVKDEKFTCSLYTDPNVRNFDGSHYKVLESGVYIGAEVPSRDFQVQTRVRKAVNCGLIFRERNDVIRIDACFNSPMIEIARRLNENTIVRRSQNGRIFEILFPSGTKIQVGLMGRSNSALNVFITLPGIDKNLSQGLCGTNDGKPGNDRNEAGKWKVSGADSLFNVVPSVDDSNCNISRRFPDTGAWCPGCIDITNNLSPTYNDEDGWFLHNATLESSPEENPINPDQTWPLPSGLTEQDATEMCLQAIQRSPLYEVCNSTLRIQAFVQDCLTDVLYTGTMDFIEGITGVFTTNCLYDIDNNPDNQELNTDVEILLDQVCLTGCGENGRCENGVCVCQPGWEGETCFLDTSKGPQINRIIEGSLCDVSQEECRTVTLDVSNFNASESLYCRFDPVIERGDISRLVIVKADIMSPFFISCEIPELEISSRLYNVSVSSEGGPKGNVVQMRLYDSTCLSCTITYCSTKTTACHINRVCYVDGATNENDESKICDISYSLTEWKQKVPVMLFRPTLFGPYIAENRRSFSFHCVTLYSRNDTNLGYEVLWTFQGQEDPNISRVTISYPNTRAKLDGAKLENHMNENVGCRVRAFFLSAPSVKSSFVNSNVYNVGILVRPNKLNAVGPSTKATLTLISSVPVVCSNGGECCINFKETVQGGSDVSVQIPSGVKLCADDWNTAIGQARAEFTVEVTQPECPLSRPPQRLEVILEPMLQGASQPYFNIFREVVIRPFQIDAANEKYYCRMTTDPHIVSFDRRQYNMLLPGIFTAVEVPGQDFKIQIETKGGAVCAVIVKEWNDVIRIDSCSGGPTIDVAYELSGQTIVQRSTSGAEFGIYLPSGTEVRVLKRFALNIFITLPAAYKDVARGLCGSNDQNPDNDFTGPNGQQQNSPSSFGRAWRIAPEDSLFQKVPFSTEDMSPSCPVDSNVLRTGLACPGCPDITDSLVQSYSDDGWTRYPVSEPTTFPDIDSNREWPTGGGITEADATKLCEEAIRKSQLYSLCSQNRGIDHTFMDDCMMDILISGTTEFLDDITSAYTADCQQILANDPTNYLQNNDQELVLKPEFFEYICPIGCNVHGSCDRRGKCICNNGWEGESCNIRSGVGPKLEQLIGGDTCDLTQNDCDVVQIEASNVYLSDQLTCKIQPVDLQGNRSFDPVIVTASAISPSLIICPLPSTGTYSIKYRISVSNDGDLYSKVLIIFVFNSTCGICTSSGCTKKPNLCHINDACYRDGELKYNDQTKVCDVSRSTTDWSDISTESQELNSADNPDIENPIIGTESSASLVTISRPNRDFLMKCRFNPPDGIARNIRVTWLVDGTMRMTQRLRNSRAESRINVYFLPPTGKLKCRVQHRGKIYESSGIDLC